MKTCTCSHIEHGRRMARTGKPRTLANACLEKDCPCEQLVIPEDAKGDILDPVLVRRFMDYRRTYIALEKAMQERGLVLKPE